MNAKASYGFRALPSIRYRGSYESQTVDTSVAEARVDMAASTHNEINTRLFDETRSRSTHLSYTLLYCTPRTCDSIRVSIPHLPTLDSIAIGFPSCSSDLRPWQSSLRKILARIYGLRATLKAEFLDG